MLEDYILLIDKPAFITSQDCLSILKKKLQVKKIGHTGTLDPMATGLMVVLVNEATKLSNYILSLDKTYLATMQLFVRTDSGDITGKVLEEKPNFAIDAETLERVFNHYNESVYEQMVPIYSAIKKDGKKLYEYARKNQAVVLPTREVEIKKLKLLKYKSPLISFEVTCSKGTYVRSLVNDMAHSFKTIGTLATLKRTHQNTFRLADALSLDDVNEKTIKQNALSIPDALSKFMKIEIISEEKLIQDIKNGKAITLDKLNHDNLVLFVDVFNNPLAIYHHKKDNVYISKRGFKVNENHKNK